MTTLKFGFPLDEFEELIRYIGWNSLDDWLYFWNSKKDILKIDSFWGNNINEDWIWGIALPLLSQAYKFNNDFKERKLIGISALPGTGKTTLGSWLESVSLDLNFKICVISIDDFYLPSEEMEMAIKDNPWNVSRGFPGSHSIKLMHQKLLKWKSDGILNVPVFDKSLRNGLGDRAKWRDENPDLLIIEGWFLGVKPSSAINSYYNIYPPLNSNELSYRSKIQKNVEQYLPVWNLIDQLWHLKPLKFEYMNQWKINQERNMQKEKGTALKDKRLSEFLRMLNVSIPQCSFENIKPDIRIIINQQRELINFFLN